MFGSYSVINVIVLLNLLIAMMSNSYAVIEVRFQIEVAMRDVNDLVNDGIDAAGTLGYRMEIRENKVMDELF